MRTGSTAGACGDTDLSGSAEWRLGSMSKDEDISSTRSRASQTPDVIVASGTLLYREGLAASLGNDARLNLIAAVSFDDALVTVTRLRPDAVVLDASTDGGLALARDLKRESPYLPLIAFGISDSARD